MPDIALIPWQHDFMPALGDILCSPRFVELEPTILFPHNRPRKHLKAFYKSQKDISLPRFLPPMLTIEEFITGLRRELSSEPIQSANQLDLVALLREIVNDLHQNGKGLLARLPEMERESFLPWGIRLARLMDDLMRQNIEPTDLMYMEGEVSEYASALLEQLTAIYTAYIERLSDKNWTTSGLDWLYILKQQQSIADIYVQNNMHIVAAGFYALSGAEDTFFKTLWDSGSLTPIIHSDPDMKHWAVAEHRAWCNRWQARPYIPHNAPTAPRKPNIRFCEGFDRHSQLAAMTEDMQNAPSLDDSAVILPDEGALLPVLHHLPDKEPNISMGYPLDRTSLAQLLNTIMTLQENRLPDGRYYWRDVIALIRHPYLRLLGPEDKPLRKTFHLWEAEIRMGQRYVSPVDWHPPYFDEALTQIDQKSAEPLRQKVLETTLSIFEQTDSLYSLGNALEKLATLLHKQGTQLWRTYLVDAECLFRLTTSVIPQLKSAETAKETYSQSTLFSLLKQILSRERVSFEPEPLGGLQVLGVLETRLLHFKRLYVLDAVEERLPGTNPFDPLLPDPLRKLLGLPDSRERDNVSGYNFYRLLMGTDEAIIYYQNGIQPGILDSKSVRSRFVEQLLWEQEKEEKRIIKTGDPLVRAVNFPAGTISTPNEAIRITASIQEKLVLWLQDKGVSPSSLDKYMQCPKRFFYTYLTNVRPMDLVTEQGDRNEFGTLIHTVLKDFFTPYVGRMTDLSKLDPIPLLTEYNAQFDCSEMASQLPYDTQIALRKTGRHRLEAFIASQEPAKIIGLEQTLESVLHVDELAIPIKGQADRIEERENGIVILDYKTGNGSVPQRSFWDDMDIWQRIHSIQEHDDPTLLSDLTKVVQSVQLPTYLALYAMSSHETPHDAGLVKLSENGKTQWLFSNKWTDEERHEVANVMSSKLIHGLIQHLLRAKEFTPQPSRRCQWCDFKTPCGQ